MRIQIFNLEIHHEEAEETWRVLPKPLPDSGAHCLLVKKVVRVMFVRIVIAM